MDLTEINYLIRLLLLQAGDYASRGDLVGQGRCHRLARVLAKQVARGAP